MAISITSIVFGLISLIIALIIFISQVFALFKTRNTSGTSLLTYVFMLICSTLCTSWGLVFYFSRMSDWFSLMDEVPIAINQWAVLPILILYLFDMIASCVVIAVKNRHIKMAKRLHITELQLSTYLLKQQSQKYIKSGKKFYYRKYFLMVVFFVAMFLILASFATCMTIFTNPTFYPGIIHLSPDEQQMQPVIITLSVCGAVSWEAISWPQFIKCIKTRDTSGISLNWAIFLPVSCLISFIYSFTIAFNGETTRLHTIGALVFNGIIVNVGILIIKIKNRIEMKKRNMTEIEYTQYMTRKKKRA